MTTCPKCTTPPRPRDEEPRRRLHQLGAPSLSDAELVEILLRNGCSGSTTKQLARELLAEHGGLVGLGNVQPSYLKRYGVGKAKAATIAATFEIARRLAKARVPRRDLLDRPDVVASWLCLKYVARDQETMGALYLDIRNRLIGESEVYRGTLSRAAVEPRAILKEGLLRSASGFVLFHTHPSGDPSPSSEDLAFTRRMAEAGELIGVNLLDHLILGGAGRWVSLGRRGVWTMSRSMPPILSSDVGRGVRRSG